MKLPQFKRRARPIILFFLPQAVMITLLSLMIYAVVQQTYRQGANDPQVQMVEDAADYLKANTIPESLVSVPKIEISKSLQPYIMIFDKSGKLLYSQATLGGKSTQPPAGVLDAAKRGGENRVTWQPAEGVRSAIVIKYFKGNNEGYVLAGRSLREVEDRKSRLGMVMITGWFVTLAGSFVATYLFLPKKLA